MTTELVRINRMDLHACTQQLMVDAIELHACCEPNIFSQCRVDALQLAQQAKEAGMKAVVVKNHDFGTAPLAWLTNKMVNCPILVGSLVLNKATGGLNPDVVKAQAQAGAKVVWMPTMSAAAQISKMTEGKGKGSISARKNMDKGISIIDKNGKLVPQIGEILEVIKEHKMVLATGHISKPEVFAVASEARRQNINVIITEAIGKHPTANGPAGSRLSVEEAQKLAHIGAYIEFVYSFCMSPSLLPITEMVSCIKAIGPEHCVLGTDFGQEFNPPPTEGFHMMLAQLLMFGLSEGELSIMVKVNPTKLLGLAS